MKHHVHVYLTVRVKTEVDAADHEAAMRTADGLLFDRTLPVRFSTTAKNVLEAEYAEEVTGYLVEKCDGAGGPDYEDSRVYGADHRPEVDLRGLLREAVSMLVEFDAMPGVDAEKLARAHQIMAIVSAL